MQLLFFDTYNGLKFRISYNYGTHMQAKQTREIAAACMVDRNIEGPSWVHVVKILVCMDKLLMKLMQIECDILSTSNKPDFIETRNM